MSNPTVEARLAALESQMGWLRPAPPVWREMKSAPKDRDILATIQEANGVAVRVVFWREQYEHWCSITGQRISRGCALAWMPMPEPYKVNTTMSNAGAKTGNLSQHE